MSASASYPVPPQPQDQVLLADWVARGMPSERDRLVARLRAQAHRSFLRA